MRAALRPLLVFAFFVCPLLFFTNLTRNPYVTQISLLNMALLAAGAALLWRGSDEGRAALPRTPLDLPLAAWTGACALSFAAAYCLHRAFFRPSMAAEGARAFLFLLANALAPYYLAASTAREEPGGETPLGGWVFFTLAWGAAWTLFPQLRGPGAAPADLWGHLWDGYGALLWAAGVAASLYLCRRGRWLDYLHLAFCAGFLASVYGVLQYFNFEFIWPQALNPYGGRSVSTFGNPNFMSSFNVVLLPLAVTFFARSRGGRRLVYGALALALEAALLCSLTRSSWLGALAALGVLLLSQDFRAQAAADPRPNGALAAAGVAMALLWPSSAIVSGYTPSVLGRVSEVVSAAKTHQAYGSFYQRVLIWTCGWLMGAENPVTGKGYGLFELFFPYYQGHLLRLFEIWRPMRTHANNGHNEIIETFSQTGLLGLGVYAWLWATFFAAGRRWFGAAAAKAGERGAAFAACVAGAAGMLVDNMLNVSVHFAVPAFLFWWAAGSAMGGLSPAPAVPAAPSKKEKAAAQPAREVSSSLKWGLRLAALALVALCWVWVRVWFREAHYFAGFKLLRQKQLAAGVRELEASKAWGPREVNAVYELGNGYAQSERWPEAVAAYRAALDANAGYDEIFYNKGSLEYVRLGRVDDAVRDLRVAQWINPLSQEVYNTLGNVYLSDPARVDDGIALFEQATALYPEDAARWANLGFLYARKKRYADAERAYLRSLTLDPGLAQAQVNLEAMEAQAGRPRPRLLQALGGIRDLEARVLKHEYTDATLALAQRLDREIPDSPKVRFFVGSLLMARGRPAEAVGPLEWVVQRQPTNLWARVNLGEAYLALGRRDSALEQYRAGLGLDPGNAVARRRLAELGAR
jgi:tetratricopeptide (TPR) repeat protein